MTLCLGLAVRDRLVGASTAGRPAMILPLFLGRDYSGGAASGHVQGPDQSEAHAAQEQKR